MMVLNLAEFRPCQYGVALPAIPPSWRPDCVALLGNNTTDGLSRFWVAQHVTFIIHPNELGLSIIPAI